MKRALIFLISFILIVISALSWSMNRPDELQSTLSTHFSIGENIDTIVSELESYQFDHTLYEFSQNRFRDAAGNPTVSPFLYYGFVAQMV